MKYTLAIHGGAGTILPSQLTPSKETAYLNGLREALSAGEQILSSGGSSLDAVCTAVMALEDNPLFNAGKGAVFTHEGTHELDASVMEGAGLKAGAVAGVRNIRNPVLLARAVMERSQHVMLAGTGAELFGKECGIVFEPDGYFYDEFRHRQWLDVRDSDKTFMDHNDGKKFGTVGAVACDMHGNLSAATSTGGMTNKRFGRVGDTPVIGSGTYANNMTCAVSCTGHGEFFLRSVVAYDVSCLMEYKGMSWGSKVDFSTSSRT